jgi:hypothetical protein
MRSRRQVRVSGASMLWRRRCAGPPAAAMDGHDERQFDGLLSPTHAWAGRPAGCRLRLQVQHLGCVPRRCPSRQNTSRAGFFGGGACPSVGLGGRNRRAASHAERARLNVTRAIRATMANLARDNPSLGRHLAARIRTGRYCSYTPIRTRRSPGSVDPGPSAEHPCTPNERRRSRKDPSWEGAVVPVDGPLGSGRSAHPCLD